MVVNIRQADSVCCLLFLSVHHVTQQQLPRPSPFQVISLTKRFIVFSFLQAGLCAPSQQSITAGPNSNEGAVSGTQTNQSIEIEELED